MSDTEDRNDKKFEELQEEVSKIKEDLRDIKEAADSREETKHNRRMELVTAISVPITTVIVGYFLDKWFNKKPPPSSFGSFI